MSESESRTDGSAMVIARVAGLPGSVVSGFRGDVCLEALTRRRAIEGILDRLRHELVELLHEAIATDDVKLRHFLLRVKRDAFNGRRLKGRLRAESASVLDSLAGRLPQSIVEHEAELDAVTADFERVWKAERIRQRGVLRECLADQGFRRGVAVSSPILSNRLDRLPLDPASRHDRRQRNLEISLLRYVSRSALKLSPYSTLTMVGLGRVGENVEDVGVTWLDSTDSWRGNSLVRLKRYALDQVEAVLLNYGPFADRLDISLNPTVRFVDDAIRWLRPGAWIVDRDPPRIRTRKDQLVGIRSSGRLMEWLIAELPARPRTLGELTSEIETTFDEATLVGTRTTLDRFMEIGLLILSPPWPSDAIRLEEVMAQHLDAWLPRIEDDGEGNGAVSAFQETLDTLDDIVALESSLAGTEDPAAVMSLLERGVDRLWEKAAPLADLPADAQRPSAARGRIYEDVFISQGGDGAILAVSAKRARKLLTDAEPVHRFFDLWHHRYDFLLTLDRYMGNEWPNTTSVPMLDVLSAAHELWLEYRRFEMKSRLPQNRWSTFDPLESEPLRELRELREQVRRGLKACIRSEGEDLVVDGKALEALIDGAPRSVLGPCLFLQPADEVGRRWILNRLFEGTGRYASRYTAAMPPEIRERFLRHMTVRSQWTHDGESVELLDLYCIQGDTLNIRGVQTPRILELPGARLDISPDRRLSPKDLWIERRPGRLPRIVDSDGRILIPVHLGGAGLDFTPNLVKFLATFGPTDARQPGFPRPKQEGDGVEQLPRLRCGDLVLERRRWIVPPALFPKLPEAPAAAYVELQSWREAHGLPVRAFFIDKIHDPIRDDLHKPQYVDFSSPLFVELFRASLKSLVAAAGALVFTEMLPSLGHLPEDRQGRSLAVEIQLDSLLLPGLGRP